MIDIKFNFNERKFKKDVEREMLLQTKKRLRELISRGLLVKVVSGKISLTGSEELIDEAKKQLT